MGQVELFEAALGIAEPWRVSDASFDPEEGRLDLYLGFARGAHFACPEGDEDACPVHDTESKTWRHLDFFEHQALTCTPGCLGSYARSMAPGG